MGRCERRSAASRTPGDGAGHFVLTWLNARPIGLAFNQRLNVPGSASPDEFGEKLS